jgi:uncharacterized RDD family membrane protein YckC
MSQWGPIADPGQRFLAYLLDSLIVGGVATVFYVIVFVVFGGVLIAAAPTVNPDGTTSGGAGFGAAAILLIGVVWLLALAFGIWYSIYVPSKKGGTYGKQIMGLKIVNELTGANLGMGSIFLRGLVQGLTGMLCFIGYFSMFFDSSGRYQGWHDKAVGSLVVRFK